MSSLKEEIEKRRALRAKGELLEVPPTLLGADLLAQCVEVCDKMDFSQVFVLLSIMGPKGCRTTSDEMAAIILGVGSETFLLGGELPNGQKAEGFAAKIWRKGWENHEWPTDLVVMPMNKWFLLPFRATASAKKVVFHYDEVQKIWDAQLEAQRVFDSMQSGIEDAAVHNERE